MTPLEALDRAIHYLDRAHETGFKAKAFVRAREVVRELPPGEVEERAAAGTLTELPGIGNATARLITEALSGDDGEPAYLVKLAAETRGADHAGGAALPRRPARRLPHPLDVERRGSDDRGDGEDGDRPRPRVHGAHRPLGPADRRPRPRPRTADPADRRRRRAQRGARAVPHPPRHGGRHQPRRLARPRRRPARPPRRRRRQRALQAAHGPQGDDPADDRRRAVAARRHPRPLHRADDRQAAAVGVRRRRRVRRVRRVGHGGGDQLPTGAPRPAVRAARAGDRRRLLVLDRQRRPRHRPARVAAPRLRPGGQGRRPDRADHQHARRRRPPRLDRIRPPDPSPGEVGSGVSWRACRRAWRGWSPRAGRRWCPRPSCSSRRRTSSGRRGR